MQVLKSNIQTNSAEFKEKEANFLKLMADDYKPDDENVADADNTQT